MGRTETVAEPGPDEGCTVSGKGGAARVNGVEVCHDAREPGRYAPQSTRP